jgi:hypothetical protein
MNLDSVVEARIHPTIGVARVVNSDEFFIGPEVPYATAPPQGGYRDAGGGSSGRQPGSVSTDTTAMAK